MTAVAVMGLVILLAVVVALWAGVTGAGHETAAGEPGARTPTPSGPSVGAAGAGSDSGEGAATPGAASPGPTSTASPGSGPVVGSEVLTPTPMPTGALGPMPTYPHVTAPLPPSASARGSLVSGYPVEVVPVPRGATVVASSVASQGDRLQIGLLASMSDPVETVLADLGASLAAAGFSRTDSPASDGSTAVAYVRGDEGVVLTLRVRAGGGTELSVAGTLVVAG